MSFDTLDLQSNGLNFTSFVAEPSNDSAKSTVLLLHGFPDTPRSFRFQLEAFSKAGFRAVAPTMRGYEPSAQPADRDYSVMAIANDVLGWVSALGEDKVHLVGHDWGASVAYAAAATAPERFLSLTTIAVPNPARFLAGSLKVPSQFLNFWYMNFFQIPGLAEYFVERNNWALLRTLWKNWSPDYSLPEEEWNYLANTFSRPGVKKAALAYYRDNVPPSVMVGLRTPEPSRLKTIPVKTLAITGANDGCIDTRLYEHTFFEEDFPKGYQIERIENAGHFVHQEKPKQVNSLILEWIKDV